MNEVDILKQVQQYNTSNPGFPIGIKRITLFFTGIPLTTIVFIIKYDSEGNTFITFEEACRYREKYLLKIDQKT